MNKGSKILLVGSDKIFAIENFYVKHLRSMGATVIHFPAKTLFSDYYHRGLLSKLLFRTGLSPIYKAINEKFKLLVEAERPDTIWVFKGMEIFPESLEWARGRGIRLVNYNTDNPFIFSGRGSGNSNITASLDCYDLHFTYNLKVLDRLKLETRGKVAFLPFGFEVRHDLLEECTRQEEVGRVCFLGNPDKARASIVHSLLEGGLSMTVFGHHWDRFLHHERLEICDAVYGDDQWKVLRRYRAQLNLMRIHNENSHNMRTFEVPGVGGIMVAPDTPEHRLFFEDGKEAFFFRDISECQKQIMRVLNLSKDSADNIRSAARARSVESGYRYEDRAGQALTEIKKL